MQLAAQGTQEGNSAHPLLSATGKTMRWDFGLKYNSIPAYSSDHGSASKTQARKLMRIHTKGSSTSPTRPGMASGSNISRRYVLCQRQVNRCEQAGCAMLGEAGKGGGHQGGDWRYAGGV